MWVANLAVRAMGINVSPVGCVTAGVTAKVAGNTLRIVRSHYGVREYAALVWLLANDQSARAFAFSQLCWDVIVGTRTFCGLTRTHYGRPVRQ